MPIICGAKNPPNTCQFMYCSPPSQNFGRAAYSAAPAPRGVYRDRCKLPQWGPERSPERSDILLYCVLAKRIWLQHFWFFGQYCNEWQNESQSRFRSNLVSASNLRHINIIVVQTGKLIFVGLKLRPPKFCGPLRPNTSNMPKAGPD